MRSEKTAWVKVRYVVGFSFLATILACGGAGGGVQGAVILGFEPAHAPAGTIIRALGHGFGDVQGTVRVNGVPTQIFTWSKDVVAFYVPHGAALGDHPMSIDPPQTIQGNGTLKVGPPLDIEEIEPNNNGNQPTDVGGDRRCHGTLSSVSDIDFFRFRQMVGSRTFRVSITPTDFAGTVRVNGAQRTLNSFGEATFTSEDSGSNYVSLLNATGDYTIQILFP